MWNSVNIVEMNLNQKMYRPSYTYSKRTQFLVFFAIILFGVLLYIIPYRNHETDSPTMFKLILSVLLTVGLLVYWLTQKKLTLVIVDNSDKTLCLTNTNVFGTEIKHIYEISKLEYEYFLDKTRFGFNNILILKMKHKTEKLDNKSGFSTQDLEEIKQIIESGKW
jgi:hypothetical protein